MSAWLGLALCAAVATATRDAMMKWAMRGLDEYVISASITGIAAALLLPAAIVFGDTPSSSRFWPALLVSGTINLFALLLVARAVYRSDLSLVAPLQSFTPVFMLPLAPLLLGERPSALGIAGVFAIVAGAYVLNLRDRGAGLFAPLRALLSDAGARMMLGVALLYSVSASVDKIGVLASGPLTWGFAVNAFVAAGLAPVVVMRATRQARADAYSGPVDAEAGTGLAEIERSGGNRNGGSRTRLRGGALRLLPIAGAIYATAIAAQMAALTLTTAAYVIAVKRTSTLFAVVIGHAVFHEPGLRDRLAGALLMLAGFIVLTVG